MVVVLVSHENHFVQNVAAGRHRDAYLPFQIGNKQAALDVILERLQQWNDQIEEFLLLLLISQPTECLFLLPQRFALPHLSRGARVWRGSVLCAHKLATSR